MLNRDKSDLEQLLCGKRTRVLIFRHEAAGIVNLRFLSVQSLMKLLMIHQILFVCLCFCQYLPDYFRETILITWEALICNIISFYGIRGKYFPHRIFLRLEQTLNVHRKRGRVCFQTAVESIARNIFFSVAWRLVTSIGSHVYLLDTILPSLFLVEILNQLTHLSCFQQNLASKLSWIRLR